MPVRTGRNAQRTAQEDGGGTGGGGAGGVTLDWRQQLVAFAQANVHSSINTMIFETDCQKYNPADATQAGTLAANGMESFGDAGGATAPKLNTEQTGVIALVIPAVAGAAINLWELGGNTNAPLIDSALVRPFLIAAYFRIVTAPGATGIALLISLVGNDDKCLMIRKTVSNTHLVFGILNVNQVTTTQAIPSNAAYHWGLVGWDGTTLKSFFDLATTPIGAFVPTAGQMDNVAQAFRVHASAGAGGGAFEIRYDKIAVLTNAP